MRRKPQPPRVELREQWQIEQGKKCGCGGTDDMCPCQNENPWPRPVIDWKAKAKLAEARAEKAEVEVERLKGRYNEPEGEIWPQEVCDAVDALEDRFGIELCGIDFASKHNRLREQAESQLQSARSDLARVREVMKTALCVLCAVPQDNLHPNAQLDIEIATNGIRQALLSISQEEGKG